MDYSRPEIENIQHQIHDLETELRELNDRAEGRSLTEGEQARFDRQLRALERATTELEELTERQEREERIAELASNPANLDGYEADRSRSPEFMRHVDPRSGDFAVRDRAMSVVGDERRAASRHLEPTQREHVEALLRKNTGDLDGARLARRLLLTENAAYRSAWQQLMSNDRAYLSTEQAEAVQQFQKFIAYEQREMSIGSDPAGGYGVPVLIDPTVILTAQESPNDLLNIARIETITTSEWKGVSSAGVSWSFDAEAAEVSDDSPTLAQPTVTTHKAQGWIPFSIEVGLDYPNFASEMARLLDAGYQELLASKLTTGTGTGEPFGIVTALDANTNVEVVVTTDGAFGPGDVYRLWGELPAKYRRNASWISSTDVQNEVRQFGNTGSGGSDFSVNLTQTAIPQLFGRPYFLNDFMADFTGTTGASNLLIVGDFSNYLIAQRAGMSVELVPHLMGTTNNRPTGQRGWFAWARVGADSVNDLAFRLLQNQ